MPGFLATVSWRDDRRRGRARPLSQARVWTERAAFNDAVVAALLLTLVGPCGTVDLVGRVSWVVGVGLMSWWATGRLGVGRDRSPPAMSSAG